MKKFILFSLAIALGGSNKLFAADTIDTILGKPTQSPAFSSDDKQEAFIDDKIIKIEMRNSEGNVIVSLPIKIGVAKLSNLFAVELQNIDEEDAQNNPLVVPTNEISAETLKQIIHLMNIYNQTKEANLESSEHEVIRTLYNQIKVGNFSKDSLIKLLGAINYLDIDLLEKVLGLVVFDQYKWQWNQEPVRPNVSLYTKRQLLALRRAINPHTRGVPLTPKQLADYRIIPQSFKDINDLKSYLNHPIAKSFSHHSNKAMVSFVRDYIEQARAANSLPELPELIKKFQAQPSSPWYISLFQAQPLTPLYIALFIEYYLQTNAQGTIADKLPHASTLSTVAHRIRSFKANHVDVDLDFSFIGNQLSNILGPLCQIIEPLCQRPLTQIDLSVNRLTSLPAELGNLTNLTKITLSLNRLHSLPAELGNLTNLTKLYLSRNRLRSLSPALTNLINLRDLDLSNNRLHSLPAVLGNLTKLKWLNLYNNRLTSLSAALGNLINLIHLNLSYNQLTEIPAELGNLINLTNLWLYHNQLTEIPASLNRRVFDLMKDDHVVFAAE
jgi:Leucine-rich repeat (LRR) protein